MTSPVSKPFHCSDCGKEFSKEKKLLSHFKVHSTGKTYKCEVCKLTFAQKPLYKKHIKKHFENGSCNCPKCGKMFVRRSWLRRHLSVPCDEHTQNNNKFICKDCGKMYDSLAGVRSHLRKGKHILPVFMCYACRWVCSTSKALFIHVLQHNDADLIVVGVDKEQRLEYFSTSKIRARADVAKLWSKATIPNSEATVEREPPALIDIDTHDDLLEQDDSLGEHIENDNLGEPTENNILNEQTENENLNEQTENCDLGDTMQSTIASAQDEFALQERIVSPFPSAYEEACTEGLGETVLSQENAVQISAMSPIESLKAIVSDNNETPNEKKSQNQCDPQDDNATSEKKPSNDNLQQNIDLIPKKMPKLVSLYPEEQLLDNNSNLGNGNVVLQNDMQMSNGLMCNSMTADPVTMTYTAPPIVNTMFLPPLFLVQNNVPTTQNIRPQNTYLMGDTLMDNLHMIEKPSGVTIMDELKSMTNEIALPKKKKKRQGRLGKKYTGVFKSIKKNDASPSDETATASKIKEVQLLPEVNEITPHSSVPTITYLKQDSYNNTVKGHCNSLTIKEENGGYNGNLYLNDKDNHPRSDAWETLMGSDEGDVSVLSSTSSSFKNKQQTNAKNKKGVKSIRNLSSTTIIRENQDLQKNPKESTVVKCQQQNPKDGIGVEDYIKKFMWL